MPKVVARFEKVSKNQFIKDVKNLIEKGDMPYVSDDEILEAYDNIELPKRKTKGSGGHDFFAPFVIDIKSKRKWDNNNYDPVVVVPTGIRCYIQEGYTLDLLPRSGQGFEYRLRLNNTEGIIDEDYYYSKKNEGHIMVKLSNEGMKDFYCGKGGRFCQGLFHEYFIAEGNENPEDVRDGGMGSTGV